MDKIIFGIENQIYETLVLCKNFFKEINLTTFFLVLAFLFILFIRKWSPAPLTYQSDQLRGTE